MKKSIIILCFVSIITNISAQLQPVLKNRKGIAILPQKGDYCIGINASPIFNYMGNFFTTNNNNSPNIQFANNNQAVFFKYFTSNNNAYRASFRFGVFNNKNSYDVPNLTPGALPDDKVSNSEIFRRTNIGLSLGKEYRKGQSTRLQGIYGYEGFISLENRNIVKYNYGNDIKNLDSGSIRKTLDKDPGLFNIGVRGFIGIEYFIAPKISFGAEFGYSISYGFSRAVYSKTETYDKSTENTISKTIKTNSSTNKFNLDTDNSSGMIKLLLYF